MTGLCVQDIGQRLKAFRIGSGLSADEIALRIGVSRAALYRYERGDPPKLETLEKIAAVLDVSLPSLLGVGVEYISSALAFFERMRQIEAEAEHVSVMFGPVSYLLTSDTFDALLPTVMRESLPEELPDRDTAERSIDDIIAVLRERKRTFRDRRPSIVSLVSAAELERFVRQGFIGTYDLPAAAQVERREAARREVENIVTILETGPIGIQVGVLVDAIPNVTFQIFRQPERSFLAVSPFRLGEFSNVRLGVAMITSAPEALALHERTMGELWQRSLKGQEAATFLRQRVLDLGQGEAAGHEHARMAGL